MNKYLSLLSITLLTGALLSSCGRKGNNVTPATPVLSDTTTKSPVSPTPSDTTKNKDNSGNQDNSGNGGTQTPSTSDATPRIELQLEPGATEFKLVGLRGNDVVLTGATSTVVATNGDVTEWSYTPSNPTEQTFKASAGAKVVIKGGLQSIAVTAGKFKSIDLSNAPSTLTGFYFFEKGVAGSISLSELKTGHISTLTHFYLGMSTLNSQGTPQSIGPDVDPDFAVDITKSVNLQELGVHMANVKTASSLPELTKLALSEASAKDLPKFTTANYPKLQFITGLGARYQEGQTEMDFSNHKALRRVYMSRSHMPFPLNVSNCTTFRSIFFQEVLFYGTKEINFLNTPALEGTRIQLNGEGVLKKEGLTSPHSGWTVINK